MPFPLAHPAAVLPLKRFCPKWLSLPALIAGSIAPDIAYAVGSHRFESFCHGFPGSVAFGLPMGLLMLAGWNIALVEWSKTKDTRPGARLEYWTAKCRSPRSRLRIALLAVLSVLIGTWTHIAWDSFTNKSGWVVMQVPALQYSFATVFGHQARVCHILWYASSFLGVSLLCHEYWKTATSRSRSVASRQWSVIRGPRLPKDSPLSLVRSPWLAALLCGALALPIGVVHHLASGWMGGLIVAVLTLGLIAVIVHNGARTGKPEGTEAFHSVPESVV
jgi:hypothetical protein